MNEQEKNDFKEDVYSKAVRAGKRTYFFDVKATRNEDFFLTITESKRIFESEGKFNYEKHKIFLYREDFEKFLEGFQESLEFIKTKRDDTGESEPSEKQFTNVDFDDLKSHE